jgi:hypothetical protein
MVVGTFVLVALAVARITLFIVSDRLALGLRRFIVNRTGDESLWSYLVHCVRCTSFWVALPAAIFWGMLTLPISHWWLMLPAWPALSYLTVLLSRLEDKD